jgi:hypothetical protein
MRRTLTLSFSLLLLTLVTVGGQVQETKAPLSGTGCTSVIGKLQNLKVGMMKIKTCCGGITLKAEVQLESGKKTIKNWYVVNSNDEKLDAEKGWVERADNKRDYVVRTVNGKACFIVEKK